MVKIFHGKFFSYLPTLFMIKQLEPVGNTMAKIDVSTYQVLTAIAKRKWQLLLASSLIFIVSFYILKYYFISYSSSTTFIVSDYLLPETTNGDPFVVGFKKPSPLLTVAKQIVMGEEMIEHLILK